MAPPPRAPRGRGPETNSNGKRRAEAGGSGRQPAVAMDRSKMVDAAGILCPIPGWRVHYWRTAQRIGNPIAADVISGTGSQLHLMQLTMDGQVPVQNVFYFDDPRILDDPKKAKTGVWDWMPGFGPDRLYGANFPAAQALTSDEDRGHGAPAGNSLGAVEHGTQQD